MDSWQIVGIVIAAIVLLLLIAYFVVKKIIDKIFKRVEQPKFSSLIQFKEIQKEYPQELIKFPSGDCMLQGYLLGRENTKGLVVVVHGLGGGAEGYITPIRYFADRGYQVFAYDNTGLLSLNSCNILIPQIPGLSVKYVLAVLNSSVAQFFFEKKFHSVKVLRSLLEQIPIPMADEETQTLIVELVDKLMVLEDATQEFKETYFLLDYRIAELYHLTAEEYKIICN